MQPGSLDSKGLDSHPATGDPSQGQPKQRQDVLLFRDGMRQQQLEEQVSEMCRASLEQRPQVLVSPRGPAKSLGAEYILDPGIPNTSGDHDEVDPYYEMERFEASCQRGDSSPIRPRECMDPINPTRPTPRPPVVYHMDSHGGEYPRDIVATRNAHG